MMLNDDLPRSTC